MFKIVYKINNITFVLCYVSKSICLIYNYFTEMYIIKQILQKKTMLLYIIGNASNISVKKYKLYNNILIYYST